MRAARALVVVSATCALGGCGGGERDRVKAKVEQFGQAAARKDYRTICDQVLAPSLLTHLAAGGLSCEQAMELGLGKVQDPTISIARITVSGDRASALTLTGARGQQGSLEAIELTKTSSGWRISSLGSPFAR